MRGNENQEDRPRRRLAVRMAETLEHKLRTVLSEDQITPSIDRIPGRFTVFPTDRDQICELIKLGKKETITLLPMGGATHLNGLTNSVDVAVSLSKLEEQIDHSPVDLIATVPAGMPLNAVQDKLKEHGQTIPLNPPVDESSTVGGVISANASGPRRHLYGTAKDWVIATTLANGEGLLTKAGARVVKNVSGYDLNKLYIGSRGTLGILLDISFKLYPIPDSRGTYLTTFGSLADALLTADKIRCMPLQVEALTLVNGIWVTRNKDRWTLAVEYAGSERSLTHQREILGSVSADSMSQSSFLSEEEASSIWTAINRLPIHISDQECFLLKIILSKKNLKLFLKSVEGHLSKGYSIKAFVGEGIGYVHIPGSSEKSESGVMELIDEIRSLGGFVESELLPGESNVERWPIFPSSFPWMKKVREALDPHGIFAPGTFDATD